MRLRVLIGGLWIAPSPALASGSRARADSPHLKIPPLRPNRVIEGISAVLLPFQADGAIDFGGFAQLVEATWTVGLTPAVNMDTGYANLLSPEERRELLGLTSSLARGRRFVAGAFIEGQDGEPDRLYRREANAIGCAGGVLGQKLALDIGDDACDPKQARSVAEKFAGMKLAFVAGHYCSSSSIQASEAYAEGGVLQEIGRAHV